MHTRHNRAMHVGGGLTSGRATLAGTHRYRLVADGRLVFYDANPTAEHLLRLSQAALRGKTLEQIFPALRETEFPAACRRVAERGEMYRCQVRGLLGPEDGRLFDVQAFQMKPGEVLVAFREVEGAEGSRSLEKEISVYHQSLIENAPVGVYRTRLDGQVEYANEALAHMLGYDSPSELVGTNSRDRYKNPGDRERLLKRVRNGEVVRDFETVFLTRDGEERNVLISATLFDDVLTGMVIDITDRKRAEETLHRQLNRLAALRAIDMAITASLDLRLTLNIALDQIIKEAGVDAACILELDHASQLLHYVTGRGFRTKALQETHLRMGEGYAGMVGLEQRIVRVPNLDRRRTDFLRSPYFHEEGFVTYIGVPLVAKGQTQGVLELFHRSSLHPNAEWFDFLEAIADQIAIAIDNARMFEHLQRVNSELSLAYDATIEGWSAALDLRDKETEGHTLRVTEMTLRLARAMGIPEAELVHIRRGALLHDIGKMGIPDAILHKAEPLTEEEQEIMRRHPVYAYDLLSTIAYLRPALDIPYCHHERWDGTGYPQGLKGEEIPLAARIFSVVDVYDALTSDRPYRPAYSREQALEYIRSQSGKYFDPRVVELFLKVIAEEE